MQNPVSGILGTASKIIEPAVATMSFFADPMADGRGIKDAIPFMATRIKNWHFPDLMKIVPIALASPDKYPIVPGIIGMGTGYILSEFGGEFSPKVAQVGRLIKKGGAGALVGGLAAMMAWLPAMNPTGVSGGGPTYSGISKDNPQTHYPEGGGSAAFVSG
jgi:hypothetical protein